MLVCLHILIFTIARCRAKTSYMKRILLFWASFSWHLAWQTCGNFAAQTFHRPCGVATRRGSARLGLGVAGRNGHREHCRAVAENESRQRRQMAAAPPTTRLGGPFEMTVKGKTALC